MKTDELILVTGATGYIAGHLIPRLLERGYRVRCLARDPAGLHGQAWLPQVEVARGDLMLPETLNISLNGVSKAYYLVHSMSSGRNYAERDLQAARNFGEAALAANLQQIIYLGGLADPETAIAPHMRSRILTGEALRSSGVPVTEFRAGVIIGSGSISFEMIRFMTEQFPLLIAPHWLRNRSQPVAIENVLDYLLAALHTPEARGGIFEIGGTQVISYGECLLAYARLRGLKRRLLTVPFAPVRFMAYMVDKLTPVPAIIAQPLIEGLSGHSVVRDENTRLVFPQVKLIDYQTAVRNTLGRLAPTKIEPIWNESGQRLAVMKHEGFFIDHRQKWLAIAPRDVFRAITHYKSWDYRSYDVEAIEEGCLLRLHDRRKFPGEVWIEWRLSPQGEGASLTQTVFFAPRGVPGFLCWYLLSPIRYMLFSFWIGRIERRAHRTELSKNMS